MVRHASRRALRRHHRARVIRARVRQVEALLGDGAWIRDPARAGALAGQSLFRRCSCHLCTGWPSPRRRFPAGWWEGDAADFLPPRLSPGAAAEHERARLRL